MGIIRTACYLITLTLFCQEDPCSPNPCQNDGECSADGTDFTCSCTPPYSGEQCDINPCSPNPCQYDGVCYGDGTHFSCACKPPSSGKQCEIECDCGPNSNACNLDDNGKNVCSCKNNYAQDNDGMCQGPVCEESEKEDWTYNGITNGPERWGESYPACNGQSQSPIGYLERIAVKDGDLERLEMTNYDQNVTKAELINNGHTMRITPQDDVERSISIEGDTYKLTQMDFHYSGVIYRGDPRGSEHQINFHLATMEIQYFHKNDNGDIAVVAVLAYEEWSKERKYWNRGFTPIVDVLPEILYKDQKTQLKDPLDLTLLMPERPLHIFRYTGSLTTPPCTEGVTWSVAVRHIDMNDAQKKEFNRLYSVVEQDEEPEKECHMSYNIRPVQPLNGRTVTRSK